MNLYLSTRWKIRNLREARRVRRAWVAQGRPTERPVVLRVGRIGRADGGVQIRDWHVSLRYMASPEPVFTPEFVTWAEATYPECREPSCP